MDPYILNHIRDDALKMDMEWDNLHMILENKLRFNGPGNHFLWARPRKAEQNDLDQICLLLNKIFNNPIFAKQPDIYQKININQDLVPLLQKLATKRLNEMRDLLRCQLRVYRVDNKCQFYKFHRGRRRYNSLIQKERLKDLLDTTYYAVHVVRNKGDIMADHWALILEGKYYLLIIQYLFDDKQNNKPFVSYQIFPNTAMGHRACWYSAGKGVKEQKFNIRWATLKHSYLKKVGFKKEVNLRYLHDLVDKVWMKHSEYYLITNNCQHFVRNIYAVLDEKNAKYLNSRLDQKNMALSVPSAPVADQVSQWVLMQRFIENANDQQHE